MTAQMLAAALGGLAVLGVDVRSDLDLADLIHRGFPLHVVNAVLKSGVLQPDELYGLVLSRRMLAQRRKKQAPLSLEESNRLARAVWTHLRAEKALGDRQRAIRWMRRENRALRGKRPIDLLRSEAGARVIERVLGRLMHGVYS